MTPDEVREISKELRSYAEHFVPRDWNYTRNLGPLKAIKYKHERDRLPQRIKRSFKVLTDRKNNIIGDSLIDRALFAQYILFDRGKNLPDGVLDGGKIITLWEEDGEYLQFVQPTVGSLIADFLDNEPENPYAVAIAQEMQRIQDNYVERLKKENEDPTE